MIVLDVITPIRIPGHSMELGQKRSQAVSTIVVLQLDEGS